MTNMRYKVMLGRVSSSNVCENGRKLIKNHNKFSFRKNIGHVCECDSKLKP